MRATISFEAEVSRVNDIMRSLVLEESNALQDALIALEKATSDRIEEGILDALTHINGVARQLEQYRQMMANFKQVKFETTLPRPAEDPVAVNSIREARQVARQMQSFDSFLDRINEEASGESPKSEEG